MKLKNIQKDIRQFTSHGQIIYVEPGQTVEVDSARFDKGSFKVVDIKKRKDLEEKPKTEKEVGTNDSSR